MGQNGEPFNVEFTSASGASKWVRDIVSHTADEIRKAWEKKKLITITDKDGGEADVDMERVFFMRFQDGKTFDRRSREARGGDKEG